MTGGLGPGPGGGGSGDKAFGAWRAQEHGHVIWELIVSVEFGPNFGRWEAESTVFTRCPSGCTPLQVQRARSQRTGSERLICACVAGTAGVPGLRPTPHPPGSHSFRSCASWCWGKASRAAGSAGPWHLLAEAQPRICFFSPLSDSEIQTHKQISYHNRVAGFCCPRVRSQSGWLEASPEVGKAWPRSAVMRSGEPPAGGCCFRWFSPHGTTDKGNWEVGSSKFPDWRPWEPAQELTSLLLWAEWVRPVFRCPSPNPQGSCFWRRNF